MVSRAVLVFVLSSTVILNAQQPVQQERTVEVSARSEIVVPPDLVLIDFTVATEAKALNDARNPNDELTRSVFQIIDQLKIPSEDFQVTDLSVSPPKQTYSGVQVGYRVERSFSVRIQNFSVIEEFLDALIDAGVSQIDGLWFHLRDQRPHLREARRQAFEYAKVKARELATLSQLELGDVISVSEGIQHNYDATGGGMGGMGGFGGVVRITPQHNQIEVASKRIAPPTLTPTTVPTLYTVSLPGTPQEPDAASAKELKLLAPGVVRLNAEIHVTFELRRPERGATQPSR